MTHFWAKTTKEKKPGISVLDHMMNVGYVARAIAENSPEILKKFCLHASTIGALAALHDLGKISPGFQQKCKVWLEENNMTKIARNWRWDAAMESDHGKVSHAAIQMFLNENNIDQATSKFVSTVLGAHHGRLTRPDDRGYRPERNISDANTTIDWDAERKAAAQKVWDCFIKNDIEFSLSENSASLWWLAGLTSVADWIGSDERFFSSESNEVLIDRAAAVIQALNAISYRQAEIVPNLSFHDLFHDMEKPEVPWIPNEMQEKTLAAVTGPGVYIIEAPMGMGKTEAALWASYQLLVAGKASGIYFALPTQATSNRMHLRMSGFLSRISTRTIKCRLIHCNSWLLETDCVLHPAATEEKGAKLDDAQIGRDWFASSKRALLAPFGVGTIDQALLGVVAAKHFFVRHFALAGKVVILDEVHSYDLYTGTLIDKLIITLEELGCTVIILSATLTGKRRRQIVSCTDDDTDGVNLPYPLITGRKEGGSFKPIAAAPPQSRNVKVDFVTEEAAAQEAITLARKGGAVVWICNTVDAAQKQYRRLKEKVQKDFPIGLLHSRFPFWRREQLEGEWLERLGKDGKTRCGCILVSTQIVEQSVDLDADFMVTELAPTDMLLQRLGRLWRHEREQRPVISARLCIIEEENSLEEFREMEPKVIIRALGSKAYVYAPFILLRSLELWKSQLKISIPSQIRQLIEATYQDRTEEPNSWKRLYDDWFGTDSAKKMIASRTSNLWQVALEDEEGVQTRLNELPTVSLVLCRKITDGEAIFLDRSKGILGSDQYRLATAQAIHKNIVKIPKYYFEYNEPCIAFADYLHGAQSIGIVADGGEVVARVIKAEIRFHYSDELGVAIEKTI